MIIRSATFQISSPNLESCPDSDLPEFAFIGRSNVGKSTLLNMLAGKNGLAKVSATPGHTQLINFFTINNAWSLVDLPGYGYAKTLKADQASFEAMIEGYLSRRTNLAWVFVLIDSRHTPQLIDLEFVQWLTSAQVPMVLVFTKTDKPKAKEVQKNIALFQEKIALWCPVPPQVFTTSAEARTGRQPLLDFIGKALPCV